MAERGWYWQHRELFEGPADAAYELLVKELLAEVLVGLWAYLEAHEQMDKFQP
jgi:hypothetical protein